MPILPQGAIKDAECDVRFRKDHGKIICLETGEVDNMVKAWGWGCFPRMTVNQ